MRSTGRRLEPDDEYHPLPTITLSHMAGFAHLPTIVPTSAQPDISLESWDGGIFGWKNLIGVLIMVLGVVLMVLVVAALAI